MKAVDDQVRWWVEIGLNTQTKMFTDIASPDLLMKQRFDMIAIRSVQNTLIGELYSLYPVSTNIFRQISLVENPRLLNEVSRKFGPLEN